MSGVYSDPDPDFPGTARPREGRRLASPSLRSRQILPGGRQIRPGQGAAPLLRSNFPARFQVLAEYRPWRAACSDRPRLRPCRMRTASWFRAQIWRRCFSDRPCGPPRPRGAGARAPRASAWRPRSGSPRPRPGPPSAATRPPLPGAMPTGRRRGRRRGQRPPGLKPPRPGSRRPETRRLILRRPTAPGPRAGDPELRRRAGRGSPPPAARRVRRAMRRAARGPLRRGRRADARNG